MNDQKAEQETKAMLDEFVGDLPKETVRELTRAREYTSERIQQVRQIVDNLTNLGYHDPERFLVKRGADVDVEALRKGVPGGAVAMTDVGHGLFRIVLEGSRFRHDYVAGMISEDV